MVVKPRHTFVDGAGLVSSSYISAWCGGGSGGASGGTSNLVDLCHDASIQFGSEPPLFAKPPGWNESGSGAGGGTATATPAAPIPFPSRPAADGGGGVFQASNPIHSSPSRPSGGGGIWGGALAAMAAALGGGGGSGSGGGTAQPSSSSGGPVAHPLPTSTARPSTGGGGADVVDLDAAWRAAAMAGLAARLRGALAAAAAADAASTTVDGRRRAQLAERAAQLEAGRAALVAEKGALEERVGALRGQAAALDAWLASNEPKSPGVGGGPPIDPDTAVEPADALSRQALAGQAEDMAIEDALYALDRALSAGGVGAEAYLRAVRRLCARQFILRALGGRVAAAQQAHKGGSAAAAAGGAADGSVALPQGDSWASSGVLTNNPLVQH